MKHRRATDAQWTFEEVVSPIRVRGGRSRKNPYYVQFHVEIKDEEKVKLKEFKQLSRYNNSSAKLRRSDEEGETTYVY